MASAPRAAGAKPVKKAAKRAKPKAVPEPDPPSLRSVVASGSHRDALEAMADQLAQDWDVAPVTIRPQIAGRLQAVLTQIASLPAGEVKSKIDDLADRRKARIAAAQARAAAATGSGQPRR